MENTKMAEIGEKRGRGRPKKPLELLKVLNAVNVTRHRERLSGEIAPPAPKMPPEVEPWEITFLTAMIFSASLR
jgi:hypothetical protein